MFALRWMWARMKLVASAISRGLALAR